MENVTGKRISFDFDDTLQNNIDWSTLNFRDEPRVIIKNVTLLRKLAKNNTIYIVSSRPDKYKQEIYDFVVKYHLDVRGIVVTNLTKKAPTLKKMGIDIHYDDDEEEITWCNDFGIKGILV